ncbi:ABC transporter permease [Abyssisolibacter fermentans]|uniref:ABC transporter permease n=1 Tax=Abyssisolibacter fermentans TaxID=1766203 RepID=UPI0008360A69|nr:ABC transporter permease [Abyssisolibacter fermentans]
MIKESIYRFFDQAWLSFKSTFGWIEPKTYFFVKILNPIFQLIFFCLLAKYCYNTDDLTHWVIGNSFLLCIYNSVFGVGAVFMFERFMGTLKMIIASPENKFIAFFQRGFVHIIDSLVTVSIGLIIGSLLFNVSFENINMYLFIMITIIAMFSAVSFGLFIGSFGLVTSQMNLIMNICAMLLMAFSGVNFPVEALPNIVQKFSYCLPITRSLKAADLIMAGGNLSAIDRLVVEEILIGIIYIIIGYLFMKITEKIAKKRATLDYY